MINSNGEMVFPESKLLSARDENDSNGEESPIGYVFDPEQIFMQAEVALENLMEKPDPDIVLPEEIDWNNFAHEEISLYQLIAADGGDELIDLLPAKLVIENLNQSFARLLGKLIDKGFAAEILKKITKVKNCEDLKKDSITFLFRPLLEAGYVDQIITLMPTINGDDTLSDNLVDFYAELSTLREDFKQELITRLTSFVPAEISVKKLFPWDIKNLLLLAKIDPNFAEKFLSRFDHEIDILVLAEDQLEFLTDLVRLGFAKQIAALIKPTGQVLISMDVSYLLHSLVRHDETQKVFDIVEVALDKNDDRTLSICGSLVEKGLVDEVLALVALPDQFELENLESNQYIFLFLDLIKVGRGDEVVKRLTKVDLTRISSLDLDLIDKLVDAGFGVNLASLIQDNVDYKYLTPRVKKVLAKIAVFKPEMKAKLLANVPPSFDLKMVNEIMPLVDGLLSGPLASELITRFTGLKDLADFSYDFYGTDKHKNQLNFLLDLARSGHVDELNSLFADLFAEMETKLRQPISFEVLHLEQKAGPHLHELIKDFPLAADFYQQDKFGWLKKKLNKGGSYSYAYLKIVNGNLQVVFRNESIEQTYLQNYQKVFALIPDYISGANYPELQGTSRKITYLTGYREVYAGPDLTQLDLPALPEEIRESIELQRKYILLKLGVNGIKHGHPHNENFNVRFLLEKNGEKQVFFDVNLAIRFAIEQQMTLTPIVTLRDWDAATSS